MYSLTGFRAIFQQMVTPSAALTEHACTSMPIPEKVFIQTGAPTSLTMGGMKFAIFYCRVPISGLISITLMVYASMPLLQCFTWIIHAKKGSGLPNSSGGRENLEAIQFLKDANISLHGEYPGILTIAEESTSWGGVSHPVYNGGLGFNMKWDMGWMNDTLRYMHFDPIYRSHHQGELSFRMIYAFTENFVLPLSHDEVVHGKRSLLSQMPGDMWQQFANLRLLYGYQYTMPGKKLLFMGGELAQWEEWNHDTELDWNLIGNENHDGIRRLVGDLNQLYRTENSLYETDFSQAGFSWIQCDDSMNSVFAFQRNIDRW